MNVASYHERFRPLISTRPEFHTTWARVDVLVHWLGRSVSPKQNFSQVMDPLMLGTIVEVAPQGFVTVLWENGELDDRWHRPRELDDYQGQPHLSHQDLLLKLGRDAYPSIIETWQTFDRSRLRRNGMSIEWRYPAWRQPIKPKQP